MFLIKEGFPEESELVLCTVSDIQFHSVFVKLDEYDDMSGMVHISEISPGRIRNIRDFVTVGKKIVCKVLRVNSEKKQIDLSLRRVNEGQKKEKISEIKQEQKAEKIIEFVAKELKIDNKELYDTVWKALRNHEYIFLHTAFNEVVNADLKLDRFGIEKKTADKLTEIIKQRIKPPEVQIGGTLILQSYKPDGVTQIKKAIISVLKSDNIKIRYEGAGKYSLVITHSNYKDAEKILKDILDNLKETMEDIEDREDCFKFIRKELKKTS